MGYGQPDVSSRYLVAILLSDDPLKDDFAEFEEAPAEQNTHDTRDSKFTGCGYVCFAIGRLWRIPWAVAGISTVRKYDWVQKNIIAAIFPENNHRHGSFMFPPELILPNKNLK